MSKQAPKHFFSKYASVNMSRSMFDYSNVDTCTIDVDYLYPNYVDMVIPGDTWKVKYTNAIRMIDPITVPMMDNLWCETHWWFVPFSILPN